MKKLLLCLALVLPLLVSSAASAGSPRDMLARVDLRALAPATIPTGWLGVWSVHQVMKLCDGQILFEQTTPDSLCPNGNVLEGDTEYVCSVSTITETAMHFTCTASDVQPGCTTDTSMQADYTRSGNSFTAIMTMNITQTGAACDLPGETCMRFEMTGTRISSDTSWCASAAAPETWGAIKTIYR